MTGDKPSQGLVGATLDGRGDEAHDDRTVAFADDLVAAGARLDADPDHEPHATVRVVDDLYRENILEHYKRPRNFRHPDAFDLEFEDSNPFCGDEQHVFITLDADGRVADVSFEGKGCAISTAATSMLTEELAGKTRDELLRLDKDFVLELLGIDISATRMKCALLGLKVVKSAALGDAADWEDEGARGDPTEAETI